MGHEAAIAGSWGATGFDDTGALIIILRMTIIVGRRITILSIVV